MIKFSLYYRSGYSMKKLVIISEGKNTGTRLFNQLNYLIGKPIEIENILVSQLKNINIIWILFETEGFYTS